MYLHAAFFHSRGFPPLAPASAWEEQAGDAVRTCEVSDMRCDCVVTIAVQRQCSPDRPRRQSRLACVQPRVRRQVDVRVCSRAARAT